MKQFAILLPLVLLASAVLGESGILKAERSISLNKVILQFNENISARQMESFFENSPCLDIYSNSIRLEYPPVIIARLKKKAADYSELKKILRQLSSHPNVVFANPVLTSGNNEVPVLREIFVKTKNAGQENELHRICEQLGFEMVGAYSFDKSVLIVAPKKSSGLNSLELSCKLAEMSKFEYVHPNLLFNPVVTTNDPIFVRQWHLRNDGTSIQGSGTIGADMSVEEAWNITRGDTSVKIAILDSGVDTLHPDLTGNLLHGFDATGGGSNGYPNTKYPNDGHGTCCAGIAAAVTDNGTGVAGVAPLCKIIPVKIFYYVDTTIGTTDVGVIPYSTTQWMADGINWAAQAGADVMSNSWGVPSILFSLLPGPVSLVEEAIDNALANGRNGKGTPLLFSTGNENASAPIWPSSLEGTIAVTATSMCDERKSPSSCDGETWGGNYDGALDVAAPGVKISTTDMIGNKGFAAGSYSIDFNGTSAACPNVAGVMALILSVRPELKASDARYILASTADKVGGYNYDQSKYAGAWSRELGFGRVNAYSAVQAAISYTAINGSPQNDIALQVYPNPASSVLMVEFYLWKNSEVMIALTDAGGKILSRQSESFANGLHSFPLVVPQIPGIYFLQFVAGNQHHYCKIISSGK